MPAPMSQALWGKVSPEEDAHIAVDSVGLGVFDGASRRPSATWARFGSMLTNRGTSPTG
jgi:hypothetical protein